MTPAFTWASNTPPLTQESRESGWARKTERSKEKPSEEAGTHRQDGKRERVSTGLLPT